MVQKITVYQARWYRGILTLFFIFHYVSPLLMFYVFEFLCVKPISFVVINRISCHYFIAEIRVQLHVKDELLIFILRSVNMMNMMLIM